MFDVFRLKETTNKTSIQIAKDLKIEQHNIMPVGERVRDMIYIEELNKIFLFLETSGSIGMLEVDN